MAMVRKGVDKSGAAMHIWYLHHYGGGPGLGLYDRPFQLARAWQRQGHTVCIFIAAWHHLLERGVSPEPEFKIEDVSYLAVPARSYSRNGLSRLANIWDFSRNLYSAGTRCAKTTASPDAIIASSPHPFSIFPAHRLARRHGAKLVFEVRDIWPLSITEILGTSRLHPFVQLCAFTERFALDQSDLIASVLPNFDQYLLERGHGDKPFIWVPNGIGQPVAAASSATPVDEAALKAQTTLKQWRDDNHTIIIHTGSLGRHNGIDLLLHALAHGRNSGNTNIGQHGRKPGASVRLLLAGDGEQSDTLKSLAQTLQLDNVCFSGRIAKALIPSLLAHADIGYGGVRPLERLYRYGVSLNKFADYYRASLPVFLPLAPCGDPVSQSGGGIARMARTPAAIWTALEELAELSPQQRRLIGKKGHAYMEREYNYDSIARRYVEAIAAA